MQAYALRIFWARFRRRIFFLRHFHRCLPGFFQARELRFMRRTCPLGQAGRLGTPLKGHWAVPGD